jgi:hypothetical protein
MAISLDEEIDQNDYFQIPELPNGVLLGSSYHPENGVIGHQLIDPTYEKKAI